MSKGYITEQELCDSLKSKFEKVQPTEIKAENVSLQVDDENFTAHNVQDAIELCVQMCETSCTESKSAKTNSEKFEKMIAQANDKADKAFQSGVDVKNKVVSALASKGFNLTTEKTWEDIVNEINSKKVEKGLCLEKTFNIKTTENNLNIYNIFKSKHNILYLIISKNIIKLDNNFNEIWKVSIDSNTPLFIKLDFDNDDNIYYSENNKLCKMNPDGRILWKQNIDNIRDNSINVYEDFLYVGTTTGVVYKLDFNGNIKNNNKIVDDNMIYNIINFKSNLAITKENSITICDGNLNILKTKQTPDISDDYLSLVIDDDYIYTKSEDYRHECIKFIKYDNDLNYKEIYKVDSTFTNSHILLYENNLFLYNNKTVIKIDKNGNLIYSQNENIHGNLAIIMDGNIYFFDYNKKVNKYIDGISKIIM